MMIARDAVSQMTVFSVLQSSLKLADKKFAETNYLEAADLYRRSLAKHPDDSLTQLKLAECYYQVKDYKNAASVYDSYLSKGSELPETNAYHYAEIQTVLKNYKVAASYYKQSLAEEPDNEEAIMQKLWRLGNLKYLYEDSGHYTVRPISFNSAFSELCPIIYKNQIVFVSNREEEKLIENVNGKMHTPFYQLYSVPWKNDTIAQSGVAFGEPMKFARTLNIKFNAGPVDFYDKGRHMVFVSSSEKINVEGGRTLGIHFASLERQAWKLDSSYPFNSDDYSIRDVTINEDGTKMYFSSDMKDGLGGYDIYVSTFIDNAWSKPINIGEPINTSGDEVFPNLQSGNLYFSSDGHDGLGALDIFKVKIRKEAYGDVENIGYPFNSNYDDFGITFDSLGSQGYLTSNRQHGGYDDDIYRFEMDVQSYPYVISGITQYKEHATNVQSEIKPWSHTKLFLVDSENGLRVHETITDENGKFSVTVPYFSEYFIEIVDEAGYSYKASLEIRKYKEENSIQQIVVVKEIFNQSTGSK
jgi:tetratricopeptide (TPR) repeat protein